ncbi:cell division cycle- protein, partial [Ascosphaera pollenicola]
MFKWIWGKITGNKPSDPTRPMEHEDRERISETETESAHSSGSSRFAEKGRRYMSYEKYPMLTAWSAGLGILASMGGFIFGYDTGQISGFIGMKNFIEYFGTGEGSYAHLTDARAGLIVSLLSIGTLIGALIAAPIADRIGRKWSLSGWCLVLFVGIIVQLTSPRKHWYQFMMGRFVAGLAVGALSLLVPLYMSEITPKHVRGGLVASYQLFITLGIFTANCINFGTEGRRDTSSWRIPLGITLVWGFILGAGIPFFPESPRYDYRWGREARAAETLRRFY